MTRRPRLLDLFAGAGGAACGYHRAGFDVIGVDHVVQPNYPYQFYRADALAMLRDRFDSRGVFEWGDFDAIHASPPCQAHSSVGKQARGRDSALEHPDLIAPTRDLLIATGLPYVIENVVGAPLIEPTMLCGSSFGLDVRRHRLFETNWPLMGPPCQHGVHWPRFRSLDKRIQHAGRLASVVGVHGHTNYAGEKEIREAAMGIDWMSAHELTQAIPPAYTELIGHQLAQYLACGVAASNTSKETT